MVLLSPPQLLRRNSALAWHLHRSALGAGRLAHGARTTDNTRVAALLVWRADSGAQIQEKVPGVQGLHEEGEYLLPLPEAKITETLLLHILIEEQEGKILKDMIDIPVPPSVVTSWSCLGTCPVASALRPPSRPASAFGPCRVACLAPTRPRSASRKARNIHLDPASDPRQTRPRSGDRRATRIDRTRASGFVATHRRTAVRPSKCTFRCRS